MALEQPKPNVGTVVPVEVKVKSIWAHVTIVVSSIMTVVGLLITVLTQLSYLPGLPTNVAVQITSALMILNLITQVYQKLNGKPAMTPTQALKAEVKQ